MRKSNCICLAAVLTPYQQCYAGFDSRASSLSLAFLNEAEILWKADHFSNSVTTLAAMATLCAASTWQGREQLALELLTNIRRMAEQMNLFGIPHTDLIIEKFAQMSPERIKATAHATWGCYCLLR
jgi:hypothetical protein